MKMQPLSTEVYETVLDLYESGQGFEFGIMNDLYYYWDYPLEEDYDWRDTLPDADCLCEICFDILNQEGKIKWTNKTDPLFLD